MASQKRSTDINRHLSAREDKSDLGGNMQKRRYGRLFSRAVEKQASFTAQRIAV